MSTSQEPPPEPHPHTILYVQTLEAEAPGTWKKNFIVLLALMACASAVFALYTHRRHILEQQSAARPASHGHDEPAKLEVTGSEPDLKIFPVTGGEKESNMVKETKFGLRAKGVGLVETVKKLSVLKKTGLTVTAALVLLLVLYSILRMCWGITCWLVYPDDVVSYLNNSIDNSTSPNNPPTPSINARVWFFGQAVTSIFNDLTWAKCIVFTAFFSLCILLICSGVLFVWKKYVESDLKEGLKDLAIFFTYQFIFFGLLWKLLQNLL